MSVLGRRFASFEELYAAIPDIDCQGLCYDGCGPIGASRVELHRAKRVGYDLLEASHRLFRLEDVGVDVPTPACSALKERRCAIYDLRPTICRLWGVTDDMLCHHGCVPERVLTVDEGSWILGESSRLGIGISARVLTGRDDL